MSLNLDIIASDRNSANIGAILRRKSDLINEGWAYAAETVPLTASVADVQTLIAKHPNVGHVQLLGHVPVPQLYRLVNSDDSGVGDCDYPYTLGGNTVARIDTSGLPVDETVAFNGVLQRHHDYRTGAFIFSGIGLINNRLDYRDSMLTPRLSASMVKTVGTDNIWDVTRQYPDEQFFTTYRGRTALLAALMSGGDPFRQSDGYFGHEYYLGSLTEVCSGRVQMGGVQIFCSYGWQFDRWPLMRGLLVGGSLWAIYNSWGNRDLSAWSETVTIAEAARPFVMDTLMGDGTLLRRAQDMGIQLVDFNNLAARVGILETAAAQIPVLSANYATMQQQVTQLTSGAAGSGSSAGNPTGTGGTANATAPVIVNGSFDAPALAVGDWQKTAGGVAGWATTGYVAHTGQPWTTPLGASAQALALTALAVATQTLNNLIIGQLYTLSIKAIQRPIAYNPGGVQSVNVFVDGTLISPLTPGGSWTVYALTFNAKAASQVLKLAGTAAGDATVYLTGIAIA